MKKFLHLEITYSQLLFYGVHVGHSLQNSLLYTFWLVYTYSQNILIINLFKTLSSLRSGFLGISTACNYRHPVWFINLDSSFDLYVSHCAYECGEMSWTTKWVNGLISNFRTLFKVFKRLSQYSATSLKKRQDWVQNKRLWRLTRFSWPRTIFVTSVHSSQSPTKEATDLKIPCSGITDTNAFCNFINMPVPGNDDSIDAIVFLNNTASYFILLSKLKLILRWFYSIRNSKRFYNFKDWLLAKVMGMKGKVLKYSYTNNVRSYYTYYIKYMKHYRKSLSLYFSKNWWLDYKQKSLYIYNPELDDFYFSDNYVSLWWKHFQHHWRYFYSILIISFVRGTLRFYASVKMRVTENFLINLKKGRFFKRRFISSKYVNDRFFFSPLKLLAAKGSNFLGQYIKLFYYNCFLNWKHSDTFLSSITLKGFYFNNLSRIFFAKDYSLFLHNSSLSHIGLKNFHVTVILKKLFIFVRTIKCFLPKKDLSPKIYKNIYKFWGRRNKYFIPWQIRYVPDQKWHRLDFSYNYFKKDKVKKIFKNRLSPKYGYLSPFMKRFFYKKRFFIKYRNLKLWKPFYNLFFYDTLFLKPHVYAMLQDSFFYSENIYDSLSYKLFIKNDYSISKLLYKSILLDSNRIRKYYLGYLKFINLKKKGIFDDIENYLNKKYLFKKKKQLYRLNKKKITKDFIKKSNLFKSNSKRSFFNKSIYKKNLKKNKINMFLKFKNFKKYIKLKRCFKIFNRIKKYDQFVCDNFSYGFNFLNIKYLKFLFTKNNLNFKNLYRKHKFFSHDRIRMNETNLKYNSIDVLTLINSLLSNLVNFVSIKYNNKNFVLINSLLIGYLKFNNSLLNKLSDSKKLQNDLYYFFLIFYIIFFYNNIKSKIVLSSYNGNFSLYKNSLCYHYLIKNDILKLNSFNVIKLLNYFNNLNNSLIKNKKKSINFKGLIFYYLQNFWINTFFKKVFLRNQCFYFIKTNLFIFIIYLFFILLKYFAFNISFLNFNLKGILFFILDTYYNLNSKNKISLNLNYIKNFWIILLNFNKNLINFYLGLEKKSLFFFYLINCKFFLINNKNLNFLMKNLNKKIVLFKKRYILTKFRLKKIELYNNYKKQIFLSQCFTNVYNFLNVCTTNNFVNNKKDLKFLFFKKNKIFFKNIEIKKIIKINFLNRYFIYSFYDTFNNFNNLVFIYSNLLWFLKSLNILKIDNKNSIFRLKKKMITNFVWTF